MPPDDAAASLPDWPDAELRATALDNPAAGADAGLPERTRFLQRVTQTIRARLREKPPDRDTPPGVFLLMPTLLAALDHAQLETVPMLDNGRTPLEGKLWFVGAAVGLGRALRLDPGLDDHDIFRLVVDELGAGDCPTCLFESRTPTPTVRFFEHGLGSPDEFETISLASRPIEIEEIFDVVDRVHRQVLVTPSVQTTNGRLWAKPGKHWARSNSEAVIHSYLRVGLVGAFPGCTIRPEQSQATGRIDLEVEERLDDDSGQIIRHALLELKVLRRWGPGGGSVSASKNEEAVEDGVKQAYAYRQERGHRAAALCCFDMRKDVTGDQCFAAVKNLARRRKVRLKAWHLFNSAKAYREHLSGTA